MGERSFTAELMTDAAESRAKELVDCLRGPRLLASAGPDLVLALTGPILELISYSRSWEGRAELAELGTVPAILQLFQHFPTNVLQMTPELVDFLFLLSKLTRNLCAGNSTNQEAYLRGCGVAILAPIVEALLDSIHYSNLLCVSNNPPETLLEQTRARLSTMDVSNEPSRSGSGAKGFLPMMLQLLGNFSQHGEASQAAVWKQFYPTVFTQLAALNSSMIAGPLCMVLYTCCRECPARRRQLCWGDSAQNLFARLLMMATVNSERGAADSSGECLKWIELLVQRFCIEDSLFPLLVTSLGATRLSSEFDHLNADTEEVLRSCQQSLEMSLLTSLQTSLLLFLSERLSLMSRASNSAEWSSFVHEIGNGGAPRLPMPLKAICFMVDVLRHAAKRAVEDNELDPDSTQVLKAVLSLLRIASSWDTEPGAHIEITAALLSHGLVELLLGLLEDLGPPQASGRGSASLKDGQTLRRFPSMNVYEGYRRDIVAVIANVAYQNFLVQERVRQSGHLLSVLQQCMVDKENPFLREWSVWAMRNLLEGNKDSQREIADLEAKMAVSHPELTDVGIDVELDPASGRPRLVNKII